MRKILSNLKKSLIHKKKRVLIKTETQFLNGSKNEETDAFIGLDFGTSCTKVVIQIPYVGGNLALFGSTHATLANRMR